MSEKDYEELYNRQDGCCAICQDPSDKFSKRLAVDHNHSNGKIRGLLCLACNTALGSLKDSLELLVKAQKYLENNK